MKKIIKNAIRCKLCGDIIEFKDCHDYVEFSAVKENKAMISTTICFD